MHACNPHLPSHAHALVGLRCLYGACKLPTSHLLPRPVVHFTAVLSDQPLCVSFPQYGVPNALLLCVCPPVWSLRASWFLRTRIPASRRTRLSRQRRAEPLSLLPPLPHHLMSARSSRWGRGLDRHFVIISYTNYVGSPNDVPMWCSGTKLRLPCMVLAMHAPSCLAITRHLHACRSSPDRSKPCW